jgi:hypothetical protein
MQNIKIGISLETTASLLTQGVHGDWVEGAGGLRF